MSMCLVLQGQNGIYIASDTRASTLINGVQYVVNDYVVDKIFECGKTLVFVCGFANIIATLKKRIKEDTSPQELKQIAMEEHQAFGGKDKLDITMVRFESGKSCLYNISTFNNFEIITNIKLNSGFDKISIGCSKAEKLFDYKFNHEIHPYINNSELDAERIFLDIFKECANEQFGGIMQYYVLMEKGIIQRKRIIIPDNKVLQGITLKEILAHCDPNVGIKLQKNSSDVFYLDSNGNLNITGIVKMQDGSSISWDYLEDKPTDLAHTGDIPTDSHITTITKDTISTTNVVAENLQVNAANINGTLTATQIDTQGLGAEKIYKPGNTDNTLEVGGEHADLILKRGVDELFRVYDGIDYVSIKLKNSDVITYGADGTIYPSGTWDFSGATVKGVYATFY